MELGGIKPRREVTSTSNKKENSIKINEESVICSTYSQMQCEETNLYKFVKNQRPPTLIFLYMPILFPKEFKLR